MILLIHGTELFTTSTWVIAIFGAPWLLIFAIWYAVRVVARRKTMSQNK